MIIRFRENITSDFDGTVIDIETIGDFNETYKNTDDSREYENIQQVIFGFINGKGLRVFCAEGEGAISGLNSLTEQILDKLERPFYAFNTVFESGVWFHQLNKNIIFDGELKGSQRESKLNAVRSLGIPNYDDPFNDIGELCKEAWERREFDAAIAHNRACLLKERDILIKRGFRKPDELKFIK